MNCTIFHSLTPCSYTHRAPRSVRRVCTFRGSAAASLAAAASWVYRDDRKGRHDTLVANTILSFFDKKALRKISLVFKTCSIIDGLWVPRLKPDFQFTKLRGFPTFNQLGRCCRDTKGFSSVRSSSWRFKVNSLDSISWSTNRTSDKRTFNILLPKKVSS